MEIINYTKAFDDFVSGVNELRKLVPETINYLTSDEKLDEKTAIENLINKYSSNPPIPANPNYPYTYSFKSDSFGITFGTDKRVRFGWKAKKNQEGNFFYVFKVTFPNAKTKSTCEYELINNNWYEKKVVIEKSPRNNKTAE